MRQVTTAALLLLSLLAAPGARAQDITVPTADDWDVVVRVSAATGLPHNLSDAKAEVHAINLGMEPRLDDAASQIYWHWLFIVKFKPGFKPAHIKVIDETSKPAVVGIDQANPPVTDGTWVGFRPSQPMTQRVYDSLVGKDNWFRLYKIVITYADGSQSVFHQGVLYRPEMRMAVLQPLLAAMKLTTPRLQAAPAVPPAKPGT